MRIKLLKQVREDGCGLGILCPDPKSAAWVVEVLVDTLTGDSREAKVTGLMITHGRRGNVQPYIFVQDVVDGLMVSEHALTWTARLKGVLQWLSVGAMEEEILPPEWEDPEDRHEVLDRDYGDLVEPEPEAEPLPN